MATIKDIQTKNTMLFLSNYTDELIGYTKEEIQRKKSKNKKIWSGLRLGWTRLFSRTFSIRKTQNLGRIASGLGVVSPSLMDL